MLFEAEYTYLLCKHAFDKPVNYDTAIIHCKHVYAGVYDKKEDLHCPECKKPGVASINSPKRYSPFLFFYNLLI
jgi:hypothetical protein